MMWVLIGAGVWAGLCAMTLIVFSAIARLNQYWDEQNDV